MPSPLMSPALLTESPERSSALMPLMAKPLVPLRLDKLKTEFAIISPVLIFISYLSLAKILVPLRGSQKSKVKKLDFRGFERFGMGSLFPPMCTSIARRNS